MSDIKRKDNRGRTLKGGESQRSDGRYQYQYIGLDKKRHSVYSWSLLPSDKVPTGKKSDKSLREKEKEIQKRLLEGENIFHGNVTLDEMFDIYLKKKKCKGKPLTPNTIKNYTIMYNKHIRGSNLGKMNIQNIKKTNIVDFYLQLQNNDLSYGTITFYQKVMSAIFNMAIDEEFISKNPTLRALDQIEGSQKKKEVLTAEEQESLIKFAKKNNPDMYRNKYLNEEHCRFHVTLTKGKEIRYVPMTQRLYKVLKDMKSNYFVERKDIEVDGMGDFVFFSEKGYLLHAVAFRHELLHFLNSYNKNAKNKIECLTPHMLRHTGCTRNAENGMDLKVLQYLMGHKSSKITNDVYNHVTQDRVIQEVLKTAKNQLKQA